MRNTLKALLASGRPAIGSWIGFADPYCVEMMAGFGFDWLMVDTEHFPIGRETLRTILMAMKGSPSTAVVRLSRNSPDHFQTALDLGAEGVVVPMINSGRDAVQAVQYCRYPPQGTRGFGPTRASSYFENTREYVASANQEISLFVQIETPEAVANIEEILAVPDIDGVFIGPADIASFSGHATYTDHPEVAKSVESVIANCNARSLPWGLPTWTEQECSGYVKRGGRLLTLGSDMHFLASNTRAMLSQMRSALERAVSAR